MEDKNVKSKAREIDKLKRLQAQMAQCLSTWSKTKRFAAEQLQLPSPERDQGSILLRIHQLELVISKYENYKLEYNILKGTIDESDFVDNMDSKSFELRI